MTKNALTLYFTSGSHDKFWRVSIEHRGGFYEVWTHWGRRGSSGTGKRRFVLPFEQAMQAAVNLIDTKINKGYTTYLNGITPCTHFDGRSIFRNSHRSQQPESTPTQPEPPKAAPVSDKTVVAFTRRRRKLRFS